MSDPVKIAAIIGAAIVAATALWVYFSPYQSCVRALEGRTASPEFTCRLNSN